jgi:hypothetical protein
MRSLHNRRNSSHPNSLEDVAKARGASLSVVAVVINPRFPHGSERDTNGDGMQSHVGTFVCPRSTGGQFPDFLSFARYFVPVNAVTYVIYDC